MTLQNPGITTSSLCDKYLVSKSDITKQLNDVGVKDNLNITMMMVQDFVFVAPFLPVNTNDQGEAKGFMASPPCNWFRLLLYIYICISLYI